MDKIRKSSKERMMYYYKSEVSKLFQGFMRSSKFKTNFLIILRYYSLSVSQEKNIGYFRFYMTCDIADQSGIVFKI